MRNLEDIFKSAREKIFLSADERRELREHLKAYALFHPVRNRPMERLYYRQGSYFYSLQVFLRKRIMPIILILALMFGGGGVSYAAENALPGDALYQIKVNVNEEVRDLVSITPEAKADWESRLVERRLEEAEQLVAGGALDPALQGIIEEKIAEHIEKVETHLAQVEEKKDIARASEISSNLETALRVHGEVFVKIKEKKAQKIAMATASAAGTEAVTADTDVAIAKSSSDDRLDDFSAKIAERAEKIAARNEAHLGTIAFEDAPGRKVSAESQAKSAEKHLFALTRLYENRKTEMTDEVRAEFEKRIADARAVFEKGNEAFKNGNYGEAFLLYQDARAFAQKTAVHIKAYFHSGVEVEDEDDEDDDTDTEVVKEIKVKIRREDDAEEDETVEESRKESAETALHKAGSFLEEIQHTLEKYQETFSDDIAGRITVQVADAESLITEGKRALEEKEYGAAYLSAQKAMHILRDIQEAIRKYAASSGTENVQKLERARMAAESALEKAKQMIFASSEEDEAIRKAKAFYEEANFVFSKGEHATGEGNSKEAVEFFQKTVRIVEEITRILGGANTGAVGVVKPAPAPVPTPIACTKEYAPVCASVNTGIVCIKAPCPTTAEKTYGNACEARVAGATVVYKGECRVSEVGEKDEIKAVCDYAAPPRGCSYVKGSEYNATTGCGLVLQCSVDATKAEVLPVKTEAVPATNTTETKADEVKTEGARYY